MKGSGSAWREGLGSAGCQPAVLGSLPGTSFVGSGIAQKFHGQLRRRAAGKLPAATGWQPVLPKET
jgi:hypothetical protein